MLKQIVAWHYAAPLRTWLCPIAFIVSFGYALAYQITPSVDARKFHEIAVNLVTKGTFCFECNVPLAEDSAIRDIGPGYQFFLATVYKIFGIHPWIIWLLQALMHAIVVAWIWRLIAASAMPRAWVTVPIFLYTIHPDVIQNNAMLMADSLFTFLLVGIAMIVLTLLEQRDRITWKRAAFLGALLGILTMIRPTGLPVTIAIIAVFALLRFWRAALIVATLFIAVQVPWAIRNAAVYDHFIYNSVVGGLDIWVGLYPGGTGEFNLDTLPEIKERVFGLSPDEVDRLSAEETKKIIREQPLFALQRTVSKFFKLFAFTKTSAFWFHYHGTVDWAATLIASIAANVVLLGLGIAGIVLVCLKRTWRNPVFLVCIGAILLMSIGPTIAVVVNRYRLPMLPFFTVLAAYWLMIVRSKEHWVSLSVALAFLGVATGIDLWGSWDKVIERLHRF